MKRGVIYCLILFLISMACKNNSFEKIHLTYPKTKKIDVKENYFGHYVSDPFRWLENDKSSDTEFWVKEQNLVTQNYLSKVPFRNNLKNRLKNMWNYEKIGSPFIEGAYTYFYKNTGLQNQFVLFRYLNKDPLSKAEVFLDPNTFSNKGTISLGSLSFSKSGNLLAYSISEGGSDWRKILVMDVKTKKIIGDTLRDIKFSGMSWYKDEGFYYSSYDKPKGSVLSDKTDHHKVFYHKIGSNQIKDKIVYGAIKNQKNRYVNAVVTEDNKYLLISSSISTSGNKLYIKNLSQSDSKLVTILDNYESDTYLLDNLDSKLFLSTNLNAPNNKIIVVDANSPEPINWKDLIPESNHVLSSSTAGGYFFAEYMVDAVSLIRQFDYEGNFIRNVKLPGPGTASGFNGKRNTKTDYYTFTNYTTPTSIYKYDILSGNSKLFWSPEINFRSSDYESKQVFFKSTDGTKVPMIITHKTGIKLDSKNPTILYGYGGFNISLNPSFSVTNAIWLELGGVYAVPNIRGGGEYGKEWHKMGTKMQKQNVFDDFISAAEYLIDNKYTSSNFLAIRGGSNGGLLVGATMTQRPDLAKVALPAVGVLDMLRYHTFTSGAGWAYDYGTSEDSKEMFEYLLNYSPVHNVREGVSYPATLVTTGDHDDRVVPAHSYKFIAELQRIRSTTNPTLIRIETDAGHGAGTPINKTIDQYADIFGFTLFNMGFKEIN